MYESHWQVQTRPFESVSSPEFYYPSECHQGALLKLRYVVESGQGAALLAGDHGSGKTLIVELLKTQLPETGPRIVHLTFPQMPPADLLAYIAEEMGAAFPADSTPSVQQSVRMIQNKLASAAAEGRRTLLVVDEAHLIEDPAVWDALRLLLNFQHGGVPDATLLLVGQLPLLSTLERMPSWEERLAVKCLLKPLSLEETACYLQHRLKTAGTDREVFSGPAVEALFRHAAGLPRRINRLADLALVIGYAEELTEITPKEIEAVCGEIVSIQG